jgi:NADH-quinone oxidoreductase subunit N
MQLATMPNLVPAIPEIFLALAAMAMLMVGTFYKAENANRTVSYGAAILLLLTIVLLALVPAGRVVTFNGLFVTDGFAVFVKGLILLASAVAIVMSRGYLELQGIDRFEFPVVIMLASLGMMMMVSANDLIALYLGLEMQSLALYIIASFQRDTVRSAEAGLKYFVLGALASGLLLYGASLVYGFSGTTGFDTLARLFAETQGQQAPLGVIFGIVFIVAGLAFKVSAVPFHMWTPDVYEGAPTPVTAFFAVAPKIAAMALFFRVLTGPFGDLGEQWQQIVVAISIASMVLGAFAAINQSNIKRLMAYSSIGHMGYALIGLAVAGEVGDSAIREDGVRGTLIYLAIYMLMNLGTFCAILLMRRGNRMVEGIDDLKGLSKTNPALALVIAIFMFSMAGIPPLAGFFGKLYIFLSAIEAGLYVLAVIGVLSSVVAAFYYLRIVKLIYFDAPEEAFDRPIGRDMSAILVVTGAAVMLFFVFPAPLLEAARRAAAALGTG